MPIAQVTLPDEKDPLFVNFDVLPRTRDILNFLGKEYKVTNVVVHIKQSPSGYLWSDSWIVYTKLR